MGSAIERLSRPPQTSVASLQGCNHASPFGSRPQQKSERQRLDHITAVKEKRLRPDDQRDRYLSEDELRTLKLALDEKIYRKGTNDFNKTYCRLRLIVLIAVTTGMRMSEIFGLMWSDAMYNEGLLAVRAKLKGGKMRYVPMPPELADELRRFMPQPANNVLYIAGNNHERIFPPKKDAKGERQRVEGSFDDLLERAGIEVSVSMISVTRLHRGT